MAGPGGPVATGAAEPHDAASETAPAECFGHRFGRLPYRSLSFARRTLSQECFQPVAVVNDPQTELYTRITECKHLTGQVHPETALTYEYPAADGDPYDPIPRPENQALFKRYESLARATPDVWFVGRLATYRCSNMDQIVAQALATFERVDAALPRRGAGPMGIPGPVVAPDVRTPAVRGGVRREAGAGALTLE